MSPSAQLVPYCAVPAALTMLTHCVCIQLSLAVRILIVFVCLFEVAEQLLRAT